jgi:hypothetical protein
MASLRSIAPIFPTSDMEAMRSHYEALGFTVAVHAGGYASAARDGVQIHFRLDPELAPGAERGAAYIAVDDADALHAEWRAAGVGRPMTSSTPVSRSGRRRTMTPMETCCASDHRSGALDGARCRCETRRVMKIPASDLLLT